MTRTFSPLSRLPSRLPSRLLGCVILSAILYSCSSYQQRAGDGSLDDSLIIRPDSSSFSAYKYSAWQPDTSGQYEAIYALLAETDLLIEEGAYDAASDKLERALRIKPNYAPAWSRLSWLALQMDEARRSVQMAKRSNSFSSSDRELQLLNWTFIRSASKSLHDEKMYLRANQKIESLGSF